MSVVATDQTLTMTYREDAPSTTAFVGTIPSDAVDARAVETVPVRASGTPTRDEPLLGVRAHHLRELRVESGLSDETIKANGIFSEDSHAKLSIILNQRNWSRKQGAALVFPFFDENGKEIMSRVKPDNPPLRNRKPCKYLSPAGSAVRVYFPSAVRHVLQNADSILLVTEGEKKALKATQEGFPTLGLIGVDCWHGKQSSAVLPDLNRIKWKGRRVFIVFDSDAAENRNVADNETLLAAALMKLGAVVKVVRLPPGPVGADGKPSKVGLDDFLVANGANELWKLLEVASHCRCPATVIGRSVRPTPTDKLPSQIYLHWLPQGAHSFKPRVSSGRRQETNWREAIVATVVFVDSGQVAHGRLLANRCSTGREYSRPQRISG